MRLLHAVRNFVRESRSVVEGRAPARLQAPSAAIVESRSRLRGSSALHGLAGALGVVLLLAGCGTPAKETPKDYTPLVARFYLEAKPDESGVAVTLPQSGVPIAVAPKPVVVEYDIANAEVAQVELGRCLLVQLNGAATRDLYRLSATALGRRLVLALDDRFVGARRIDQAIEDGTILTFVELPDEELLALVARLKRTSVDLAAAARKARP